MSLSYRTTENKNKILSQWRIKGFPRWILTVYFANFPKIIVRSREICSAGKYTQGFPLG